MFKNSVAGGKKTNSSGMSASQSITLDRSASTNATDALKQSSMNEMSTTNSLLNQIEASVNVATSTVSKLSLMPRRGRAATTVTKPITKKGKQVSAMAVQSAGMAQRSASPIVGGAKMKMKMNMIKQIALYRDRQPIIGLKKRYFN